MEKVVLIGGAAGQGTGKTSYLLGKAAARAGAWVFNYRDYPSLIRGGHNFNILKIADYPISSHDLELDLLVALDQKTLDLHSQELKPEGQLLTPEKLNTDAILKELEAPPVMANNLFLGAIFKLLGLPIEPLIQVLAQEIPKYKDLSEKAIRKGFDLIEKPIDAEQFQPSSDPKYFLTGNEAVAAAAAASGVTHYFGYPMTPATSVFTYLETNQKELGVQAIQLENEIAVINAALGASFSGGVAMCGTSGGGFDLMAEALSLAGMSELPLVVFLAQRSGPSTGIPTYTSQADLQAALYSGHGEFVRIVVAPGDSQEAFTRTQEIIKLTQKYRCLGLILSDKHLGEDHYTAPSLSKFDLEISPRLLPGGEKIVRATSYEHDEDGLTVEDEISAVQNTDKRLGKLKLIESEISKLNPVSIYGQGQNLIIAWGSTKGAVVDALPHLPDWRFMQISWISPFPTELVKAEIAKAKKVVLIEGNATGQLGQLITQNTGINIKDKILKYNGRAFTPTEIVSTISKL